MLPPSHSVTYTQRYNPLKMRGENQAGPLLIILNCVDALVSALVHSYKGVRLCYIANVINWIRMYMAVIECGKNH